ncbi:protein of unknown function [Cnuella takakiae]|uniref:Type 9 secretion system plug protein N-terminal domain-containing protein n=1 Tax=Cnuella takakiae TaxID=1302690 RepID=A0A1M4YC68_9BACT|nr:DUF5103 domain-containing protein [Cnuella takakiae]OLY93103.1 hypothetical protein BUE76_15290 [Cnuella takakiae]SHF03112.1 protein of unknown function [Cnuella takakiae]
MKRIACFILFLFLLATHWSAAQNIHSIKLFRTGDQTTFPILQLGGSDLLELHFDDLDADIKNYYYAFQLCNADWSPALWNTFDYIKGFQNVRITTYRNSSLSNTRYTHYQAQLPDRNSVPTRSGNYILKVFLNGDTSKTVFRRRFVVTDNKVTVGAQVQQPFNAKLYRSGQKLVVAVNTDARVKVMSPTDLKVVVLQNNNWTTSFGIDRPTIYRNNYYEYSDEAFTALPSIREFRWSDLRSFRLQSERVQDIQVVGNKTSVTINPDKTRADLGYVYYRDLNGSYTLEPLENINPFWQTDYASVRFSYFPPENKVLPGQDLYIFGEFTNWAADTSALMQFNAERGAYEKTLLLKQGYYSYAYATMPAGKKVFPDFTQTEGNFWNAENSYTILVYFRPFGARADELIGATTVNSLVARPGGL